VAFHVEDELADLHLNLLEPGRKLKVEQHLKECPACAAKAQEVGSAIAAMGAEPLKALVRQLQGGRRFHHFAPEIAQLFDLPENEARQLLDLLDVEGAWKPIADGLDLLPVRPGPRCAGAMAAFLRLQAGTAFPFHRHTGPERTLVLQGGYLDSSGRELWRGESDPYEAGTEHSLTALPGVCCIAASVLWGESPFRQPAR
jgi:anti-sigma factor ChrR (cupin superfamily)